MNKLFGPHALVLLVAAILSTTALAAESSQAPIMQTNPYPLDFCLVSGDKLGGEMGEPVDVVMGNRVCCKGCIKSLHKAPLKYQAMLDDALAGKAVSPPEDGHKHGDH